MATEIFGTAEDEKELSVTVTLVALSDTCSDCTCGWILSSQGLCSNLARAQLLFQLHFEQRATLLEVTGDSV